MADETKEDAVGVNGLENLQDQPQDDHTPGDFADGPKDAEGRRVEEEPAPALRTENVTAEDPNPGQKVEDQTATDPHPEAEDPEQHIGDELPDPWVQDAVGSWNPVEDDVRIAAEDAELSLLADELEDPKHAEVDAAWDQALNGDKEENA